MLTFKEAVARMNADPYMPRKTRNEIIALMQRQVDALETLTTVIDWEAIYIANEASEDEVRRRADILLRCNRDAKLVLVGVLEGGTPDTPAAIKE